MSREVAERLICERGWLSHMPEPFRIRLLQNALLLKFEAGQVIFRRGEPAGGIYGLVTGTVIVNSAPPDSAPRLIHIARPGGWTGEDSFMTGQPRRIELVTQSDTWVMHVPLKTMEQMVALNPNDIRAFGTISILASDSLLRIVHDLQKKMSAPGSPPHYTACPGRQIPRLLFLRKTSVSSPIPPANRLTALFNVLSKRVGWRRVIAPSRSPTLRLYGNTRKKVTE